MASCLEGFEVPQQMLVEFGVVLCVFFKIRIVVLDLRHGFGIYNSGKCISCVLLFEISQRTLAVEDQHVNSTLMIAHLGIVSNDRASFCRYTKVPRVVMPVSKRSPAIGQYLAFTEPSRLLYLLGDPSRS